MRYPEFIERHQKIDASYKEDMKKINKMPRDEIDEYIKLLDNTRRAAVRMLEDEFKNSLFFEYGMDKHPKREQAYKMAWDRGHSAGYGEVESEFMDLAELLVGK